MIIYPSFVDINNITFNESDDNKKYI